MRESDTRKRSRKKRFDCHIPVAKRRPNKPVIWALVSTNRMHGGAPCAGMVNRHLLGMARQIEQSSVSQTQQRELLESVQLYREDILTADYETQRFMLDRFNFVCRLRYDEAGTLWLDMALLLGKVVAIVTKPLQNVEGKGTGKKPVSLNTSILLKPAKKDQ